MKRERIITEIKNIPYYFKESIMNFREIITEVGAERLMQYTLALVVLATMILAYAIGFYGAYKGEEFQEKQQVAINGIHLPAKYVGKFTISHYCSCPLCTGTAKGSRTATGHIPREGRTVAVDRHIIPLHSVIYVEGLGTFVAEDVGGAVKGNHLDIYIDDHQRALNLGTLKGATPKVYILD